MSRMTHFRRHESSRHERAPRPGHDSERRPSGSGSGHRDRPRYGQSMTKTGQSMTTPWHAMTTPWQSMTTSGHAMTTSQHAMTAADSLYKHVLYKHTRGISTKSLIPIAWSSVQVSFVISTRFCMMLDNSTARDPGLRGVLMKQVYSTSQQLYIGNRTEGQPYKKSTFYY